MEKQMYEAMSPIIDKSGARTYVSLLSKRQQVGAALLRAYTPFESIEERNLRNFSLFRQRTVTP